MCTMPFSTLNTFLGSAFFPVDGRNVYHPSKFLPLNSDTHPSESDAGRVCPLSGKPPARVAARTAPAAGNTRVVKLIGMRTYAMQDFSSIHGSAFRPMQIVNSRPCLWPAGGSFVRSGGRGRAPLSRRPPLAVRVRDMEVKPPRGNPTEPRASASGPSGTPQAACERLRAPGRVVPRFGPPAGARGSVGDPERLPRSRHFHVAYPGHAG